MNLTNKMISFGVTMVVLMLMITSLAYYNLSQMSAGLTMVGEVDVPLSNQMSRISNGQLAQSAWLERSLLAAELNITEDLDRAANEFRLEHEQIDQALHEASETIEVFQQGDSLSEQELDFAKELSSSINGVRRSYDEYYATGGELLSLLKAGDIIKADAILKDVQKQSADLLGLIEPLADRVAEEANRDTQRLVAASQSALATLAVIGIFALLATLGLSFFITRSVLTQLGADPAELERVAEHLSEGQLQIETRTDVTGVAASIAKTVTKLQSVISGIQAGAEEVSMASEQVGQGNTNLSQRTQEQASSLEEVAASMEEMTSTVNQNAENANQANQMAIEASQQAEDGGSIASRAVVAMNEINDSSKRISEIIAVIDDISFQINLLALNAAVEAARAGDQGRGFAVVAGEVRNLAGRSATAAKEIKELIQDSVGKVESGTRLVDETGTRLADIVGSIKKVSDNVAEIAAASREQSDGIAQVNRAILQMDDMTQQNASLVEEAAAASETVDSQARELKQLIAFFKLSDEHKAARRHRSGYDQGGYQPAIDKPAVGNHAPAPKQERSALPIADTVSADEEWEQF